MGLSFHRKFKQNSATLVSTHLKKGGGTLKKFKWTKVFFITEKNLYDEIVSAWASKGGDEIELCISELPIKEGICVATARSGKTGGYAELFFVLYPDININSKEEIEETVRILQKMFRRKILKDERGVIGYRDDINSLFKEPSLSSNISSGYYWIGDVFGWGVIIDPKNKKLFSQVVLDIAVTMVLQMEKEIKIGRLKKICPCPQE